MTDKKVDYSPIDFSDVQVIEIPVTIGDTKYILAEASGESSAKFRNMMLNNTELLDGKPVKVINYADVEVFLVHLCIRYEENDKQVPIGVVKQWPARVVSKLFTTAKDISELDEDDVDEEQAKNEQSDTTDGLDSPKTQT
ncbi:hypothetical protein OAG36_00650 [bacterium]|nr:hypothetical protein [bacterium]